MAKSEKRKRNVFRTLHYFWWAAKKHKVMTLGWLVITPITIIIRSIIIPYAFADLIGVASNGITEQQIYTEMLPLSATLIGLYIVSSLILEKLRMYWNWKSELLAMYDLAGLCFDKIAAESMQFHNNRFSGSLVSQTNRFIGSFERFADVLCWSLLPLIVSVVGIIVILFPLAPAVAIGMLALVIGYTLISGLSFKKIAHLNEEDAAAESKQTGQLADSISNIASVKSYAREAYERERYSKFRKAHLHATNKVLGATMKRDVFFSAINIGLIALVLFFLSTGTTWFGLSIATLILITNYSQQILGSLWDINNIFRGLNRAFGDAYQMTEILDLPDEVVDEDNATVLKVTQSAISFEDVTFKHADAKAPVFKDFSLSIQPGERVGLVGVSGSGKTTLTKLLLRFADVNSGEITIDGQNIRYVTQESLRKNIAYVPQETALFHRSIAENIAYGKPNATQREIEEAAKLANAHEFIQNLPQGYETLVGERGIKLSGGQRQRVAIARAILKNAPILVLDEATSALDSESEALIQEALDHLMKNRTSIVIAHRLSTVANLDRIVVLDDGKIAEQGTHLQLLKQKGAYSKLWSRQSGAFLSEDENVESESKIHKSKNLDANSEEQD